MNLVPWPGHFQFRGRNFKRPGKLYSQGGEAAGARGRCAVAWPLHPFGQINVGGLAGRLDMWKKWLSEERATSMVGADFSSAEDAQSAADAVREERGLESSALRVIGPGDPQVERKLEPESRRIFGTLVRAHLVLGAVGLLAGLVLSVALVGLGVRPLVSSPVASISLITAFATVAGLLAGGLFTLRPDHDPIIHRAKSAVQSGRWFVIVHTRRPEQRRQAERVLGRFGGDTLRTI